MNARVTMSALAKALGLSESTISRALKGDPRIGKDTRDRVNQLAAELGYRPNPLVSALMSVRKKGGSGEVGTVALVTDYHGEGGWRSKDVCLWEYAGICRRADELGYRVEEFPMSDFHYDAAKLEKALLTRGIRGVLLGFSRDRTERAGLSINQFTVAGLSTYFREVPVDRANFHGFFNVQLALGELRAAGYKRTGLVVPEFNNRISGYLWSGGALDWQTRQAESDRCTPFIPHAGDEEKDFAKWVKRENPDSLLVYKFPVKSWLSKSGLRVPEDIALAYLYRTEDEMKTWPGIHGNLQAVGAAAFDLVVEGLHTHRLGAPADPKEVLIKGIWKATP
ncbi:MAG: LacI family DNA-binding transcriptional regulator [Luteolibacter sp.]|uniref:LacI family DNA-binding transcriptional regulator n=1 Tax=Luteolibacter sp. TaxID=1962973 RepID=UPI0032639696